MTIERFGVGPATASGGRLPFSKAVRAGGFVFVSGQIGMGADGNVVPGGLVAESRQTLDNVAAILASVGLGLKDVVKATVWLEDARDFWTFNGIWLEYFGEDLPARSCVESRLMSACKVEVEVMAYDAAAAAPASG